MNEGAPPEELILFQVRCRSCRRTFLVLDAEKPSCTRCGSQSRRHALVETVRYRRVDLPARRTSAGCASLPLFDMGRGSRGVDQQKPYRRYHECRK